MDLFCQWRLLFSPLPVLGRHHGYYDFAVLPRLGGATWNHSVASVEDGPTSSKDHFGTVLAALLRTSRAILGCGTGTLGPGPKPRTRQELHTALMEIPPPGQALQASPVQMYSDYSLKDDFQVVGLLTGLKSGADNPPAPGAPVVGINADGGKNLKGDTGNMFKNRFGKACRHCAQAASLSGKTGGAAVDHTHPECRVLKGMSASETLAESKELREKHRD